MEKIYVIGAVGSNESMAFLAKNDKTAIATGIDEYGVASSEVIIHSSKQASDLEIAVFNMTKEHLNFVTLENIESAIELISREWISICQTAAGETCEPDWFVTQKIRTLKSSVLDLNKIEVPKDLRATLKFRDGFSKLIHQLLTEMEGMNQKQYDKKRAELLQMFKRAIPKLEREKKKSFSRLKCAIEKVSIIDPSFLTGIEA
ncbi:hypothetical protein [Cytobacillus pseudoceanisediminis]|uniref:hypothetical protein n=1 Tax=Cytobacillus pseudoceanisediminis TaxID=3051614 RepID=UPI003CEB27BC